VDVVEGTATEGADGDVGQVVDIGTAAGAGPAVAGGIGTRAEVAGAADGPVGADALGDALGAGAAFGEEVRGAARGGGIDFDDVGLVVLDGEAERGVAEVRAAVAGEGAAVDILDFRCIAQDHDCLLPEQPGGLAAAVEDAKLDMAGVAGVGGGGEFEVEAGAAAGVHGVAEQSGVDIAAGAIGKVVDGEAGVAAHALAGVPGDLTVGVAGGGVADAARVGGAGRFGGQRTAGYNIPERVGAGERAEHNAVAAAGTAADGDGDRDTAQIEVFVGNGAAAVGFAEQLAGVVIQVVEGGAAGGALGDALAEGVEEVRRAAGAVADADEAFSGVVAVSVGPVAEGLAVGVVSVVMGALAGRGEGTQAVAEAGEDVGVGG